MKRYRAHIATFTLSLFVLVWTTGCGKSGHATTNANGGNTNGGSKGGSGTSNTTAKSNKLTITFGIYQTDKPTEMFKKFQPMTSHLADSLSVALGQPTSVELKILPTYEVGLDAIVSGDVDFMRLGPASYILAKRRNPEVNLLAIELKNGEKLFKGVIVVHAESQIKTIADLKGKSFAFGDENSTIGRYLVQDELVKAGIHANDLGTKKFLGRHDKVAKAVAVREFDAGSCKISTFEKANSDGQLRVIKEFENVTKPWVAKAGMKSDIVDALRNALLETRDEAALASLKASGFSSASDDDYSLVRAGMKRAESFGEVSAP